MEERTTIRWITKNHEDKLERNKLILNRYTSGVFDACYALRGSHNVIIVKLVIGCYKQKWARTQKGNIEGMLDWYECFEERQTIKPKKEWQECT